jgi:hypothetical protein
MLTKALSVTRLRGWHLAGLWPPIFWLIGDSLQRDGSWIARPPRGVGAGG